MSESETQESETSAMTYPRGWLRGEYAPETMSVSGREYLRVQERVAWFVTEQRALIAAGLAREPYVVVSEIVAHDGEAGWAQFRATVRDVLGNQAIMHGSESVKDFKDYIEKAETKALGRALAMLGYSTADAADFAEELTPGRERPADSPRAPRGARPGSASSVAPPAHVAPASFVVEPLSARDVGSDPDALRLASVAEQQALYQDMKPYVTDRASAQVFFALALPYRLGEADADSAGAVDVRRLADGLTNLNVAEVKRLRAQLQQVTKRRAVAQGGAR